MTKEEIGEILKKLRLNSGMTQKEVAKIIGRTQQVIGHWETGYSQPDANTLFLLCDIYGTTIDKAFGLRKESKEIELTPELKDHIKKYRSLDAHGKSLVDTILDMEYNRVSKLDEQAVTIEFLKPQTHLLPYYWKSVSAGPGEWLFDDMMESHIPVTDELAKKADFAVRISGDSMEPEYHDNDIVLISAQKEIEIGEIGIFILNGKSYIKKAGKDGLISLNPAYDLISVNEDDHFQCVGKVIGKVKSV